MNPGSFCPHSLEMLTQSHYNSLSVSFMWLTKRSAESGKLSQPAFYIHTTQVESYYNMK